MGACIYVLGIWGLLRVGDTGWSAGPPGPHRQGPHHAIIPGDIVEGFTVEEIQEVDGEQNQQCGQCHVAPQEGERCPHQAAQLTEHLSPEPG